MDKRVRDLINEMEIEHGKNWAFELLLKFSEMGSVTNFSISESALYSELFAWLEEMVLASDKEAKDEKEKDEDGG